MRRLSSIILLIILSFSATVYAQQTSAKYDIAASAYQSGNLVEAEQLWIELANQGDPNAQYALGIMHLKKEAQKPEEAAAFSYLLEAAKKQHVASMFNLGVAYWEGRGVARQPEKALNWWEVAAQRDDAGAQFNLGLAYYIGEGRAQNTPKATYWVQQAADNGHPQAQALLVTIKNKSRAESETKIPAKTSDIAKSDRPESKVPNVTKQIKTNSNASMTSMAQKNPRIQLSNKLITLRAAPNEDSALVHTLKSGTSIRTIKIVKEWSQVMVARSYPVWVYETFLIDLGNGAGKIKGTNVNIRPSASTNNSTSPPLGQLNEGDRVSIVLKRSPWVQILPSQPFPAWVKTRDMQ
jgi:hypothetical protein